MKTNRMQTTNLDAPPAPVGPGQAAPFQGIPASTLVGTHSTASQTSPADVHPPNTVPREIRKRPGILFGLIQEDAQSRGFKRDTVERVLTESTALPARPPCHEQTKADRRFSEPTSLFLFIKRTHPDLACNSFCRLAQAKQYQTVEAHETVTSRR